MSLDEGMWQMGIFEFHVAVILTLDCSYADLQVFCLARWIWQENSYAMEFRNRYIWTWGGDLNCPCALLCTIIWRCEGIASPFITQTPALHRGMIPQHPSYRRLRELESSSQRHGEYISLAPTGIQNLAIPPTVHIYLYTDWNISPLSFPLKIFFIGYTISNQN
jgi:hypothetical protein